MDFVTVKASKDDSGRRLDRIIRKYIPEENISVLYKSIRKALIKLNGKKTTPDSRVNERDLISIAKFLLSNKENIVEAKNETNAFKSVKIETVFENDDIKFINKNYDENVQDKNFIDSINAQNSSSLSFKSGPLHRLDRKTTGLLAFSKSLKGALWFSNSIKNHTIKKLYLGIIENHLEKETIWRDNITQNATKDAFYTMKVAQTSSEENVKVAETSCKPLFYGEYYGKKVTLALFEIATGRKHQIRLQSSFHGFPLLGDTAYKGQKINESRDFFLHAYKMIFPKENELFLPEILCAPILTDFEKMLNLTLKNWDLKDIL